MLTWTLDPCNQGKQYQYQGMSHGVAICQSLKNLWIEPTVLLPLMFVQTIINKLCLIKIQCCSWTLSTTLVRIYNTRTKLDIPTEQFTILDLQNPLIYVSELHRIFGSTAFWDFNLLSVGFDWSIYFIKSGMCNYVTFGEPNVWCPTDLFTF